MEKISAVYKIVNEVTGDFYIGSSKNVYARWAAHKSPSKWKEHQYYPLYQDMQKYGLDKFDFQILVPVIEEHLTQVEQELIDMLKPTYNKVNAKGKSIEKCKKHQKKYRQSEKGKKAQKKYDNKLCYYNGETLTLCALSARFRKNGIKHSTLEAKKYLIK